MHERHRRRRARSGAWLGARAGDPSAPVRGAALPAVLGMLLAMAGPAAAKDTGYVFVSHEKSDALAVIDPKQDYKILRWIPTSKRPRDMQFDAGHGRIFVTCGDDNTIDVVDVATLAVVDHIPTGNSPEMLELSADGASLFVSDEDDSAIRQIDIATKAQLREIATGGEPEGIAVAEDGRTIYAASEASNLVQVIDLPSAAVSGGIVVGTRPRRFAKTPDGRQLWVTDELSGEVSIVDRATNTAAGTIRLQPPGFRREDVTPVGIVMSRDGRTAYVTLGHANHIAFVDVAKRTADAFVLTGSRAWGIAETRDGRLLYVANGQSDDLSIIDVASRRNVRTLSVGRVPHSVLVDD